jgi:hypothetical protein
MKANKGSRGVAPLIVTSALYVSVWSTARSYAGKETLYLFNRRLAGYQGLSVRSGEERNLLSLAGLEPQLVWSIACTDYLSIVPFSIHTFI